MRLTGAIPIMILLVFYSLYLACSYTQPQTGRMTLLPYRVHLQSANAEILELLPGIGTIMAQRIVEYRNEHGIDSPQDLIHIKGIGQKKIDALQPLTIEEPLY